MHKPFGQIPSPNPRAASDIADAARRVERLLHDDLDAGKPGGSDDFPQKGVDIPADDDQAVVEEIDSSPIPDRPLDDDESHDGAAGGVVERGIEYLACWRRPKTDHLTELMPTQN